MALPLPPEGDIALFAALAGVPPPPPPPPPPAHQCTSTHRGASTVVSGVVSTAPAYQWPYRPDVDHALPMVEGMSVESVCALSIACAPQPRVRVSRLITLGAAAGLRCYGWWSRASSSGFTGACVGRDARAPASFQLPDAAARAGCRPHIVRPCHVMHAVQHAHAGAQTYDWPTAPELRRAVRLPRRRMPRPGALSAPALP
jgi:hypothetical protein